MLTNDSLQKFLFNQHEIRGEILRLGRSFDRATQHRAYPAKIKTLLGETVAATLLMTGTLKFEGRLSLHARGSGPVSLLMAEASNDRKYRCLAEYDDSLAGEETLNKLLGNAQLAITIEPRKGQRYQGIVPLERDSIAACLEHYFELSEQLDTHFSFFWSGSQLCALMLQKLPAYRDAEDQDAWDRVLQFVQTLSRQEVFECDNETLLHRLFHEESLQVYPAHSVEFECSCSRERMESSLKSLGQEELLSILEEEPLIAIDCHFCDRHYEFDRDDINTLLNLGKTH